MRSQVHVGVVGGPSGDACACQGCHAGRHLAFLKAALHAAPQLLPPEACRGSACAAENGAGPKTAVCESGQRSHLFSECSVTISGAQQ